MNTIHIQGKSKDELFRLAKLTGHGEKAKDTPACNAIQFPFYLMQEFSKVAYEQGYRFITPATIGK